MTNLKETGKKINAGDSRELAEAVEKILSSRPSRMIFSSPKNSGGDASAKEDGSGKAAGDSAAVSSLGERYEKIILSPRRMKDGIRYQAEQFTKTQVYHRNMEAAEVESYVLSVMKSRFRQLNSFSDEIEYNLKLSKKGKVMLGSHAVKKSGSKKADGVSSEKSAKKVMKTPETAKSSGLSKDLSKLPSRSDMKYKGGLVTGMENACSPAENRDAFFVPEEFEHNRKKKRLIEEGTVVPPLIDMGIFTKDGKIVRSMGDKFRQINRFLEIVDDAVEACGFEEVHIVDFGCGKAYLTFILYYYLTYVKNIRAYMTGLDLKVDVIRKCNEAAKKYGYENLKFEVGDISVYESDEPIDMVITLHACDTATDYALYHAVQWNSRVILSVPCCQHELNAQIESDSLSALTKYGLLKERFAALATDALRASLLEYSGYKTQVLEFVDFSHTPKNVLIRAVKTNVSSRKRERSLQEVESLMEEFHADPTLYRLLTEK